MSQEEQVMTNQEKFYKGIEALNLTDEQTVDVKMLALEFAHQEGSKAAELGYKRLMDYLENRIDLDLF